MCIHRQERGRRSFGFPVSGEEFSSATLLATERNGPELWVGDAFGPESGLLAFAATGLGCVLIAAWVRWRYGRIALFAAIAVPPQQGNRSTPLEEIENATKS